MKKHLFLIILTLAVLSVSNVWAGDTYIFPVTSASACSGGTLSQDANGMWYYEMSDASDYVEIQFAVTELQTYLVKVGYTTSVTGATCNLQYYRQGGEVGSYQFGMGHGASISDVITEANCGAQLNDGNIYTDSQYKPPYAVRVHPAQDKTMRVYYLKLEGNATGSQTTETIPSSLDLVFTSTANYNMISNSDFLYTGKEGEQVKAYDKEGTRRITFKNGIVAASRKLYTFETGTYKFTFHAWSDVSHSDYKAPYVFINGVVAGASDFSIDKDVQKSHDIEVEIDVAAGTYPVEFYFPDSYNEQLFYKTVSVEKMAVSCPGYTFHYGTNEQSDWTIACFENGAETDERVIENFTIPTVPDFYVGWQGNPLDNNMTVRQAWNTEVEDMGNGVMNGAMVLLPVRGTSKVGWAQGAVGTLRCWYGSKSKNQYVGFQPNGYAIMYGGNNYAFEETGTANKLETDVVTLPAVSTTYQMGIATADGYTTCAHSNAAEAISNMGVTVKDGGKKKILFNPAIGGGDGYVTADAKIAVYDVTNSTWDTDFMSDADGDGIYEGHVADNCETIIIARFNKTKTSTGNWDDKYNQTNNYSISGDLQKIYKIDSWCSGDNCKETISSTTTSAHPATGQKGKFRMWANSADQNWYVHWIPYYVLSYDANGGSGTTAATERNSESSTLTVSVASNGFTAPTGHEFAGWNTLAGGNGDTYAAGASYTLTANGTLYAQWSPLSYTVTLTTNGGTINSGDVTSYTYGIGATLPTDVTKTGYDFGGWYANSGLTDDRVYSIANDATGNKEYWAKWTAKTTTITIDANTANHGSSTPGTVTATWGQALPEFTAASGASGWSLEGYYSGANDGTKIINADGTLVASTTYTTADSKWNSELTGLTLYPHYEEMTTYSVTVNRNNDSYGTVTGAGSYASGATVNITATPAGGYEFVNWETSDGVTFADANSASTSFTMIGSTVTVTANFQAETCYSGVSLECEDDSIAVGAVTGGTATPSQIEFNNSWYRGGWSGSGFMDMREQTGELYLKPVHIPAGTYQIDVWRINGNNRWLNLYSTNSTSHATISYKGTTYYKIAADGYSLQYNQNSTDDQNSGGEWDKIDKYTRVSVTLLEGDYIIGLYSKSWCSWDKVDITNNSTYTVNYATGDSHGTSISAANTSTSANIGNGSSVAACTNVTFTAGVADNFEVNYWTVNDVPYHAADGETTFSIDVNRNITVKFYTKEASAYAVTVNSNNDSYGSAVADAASYKSGETVTLTATPETGYGFVNWTTSDGVSFVDATSASTTFTMPGKNVTVTANFAPLRTVNYEVVGGHGSISAAVTATSAAVSSGSTVVDGTLLTFTATPDAGYSVLGWYTYLSGTETYQNNTRAQNTFNYNVTVDITIRVKFTKIRIATGDANLGSTDGYANSNDGSTIATSNVDDPEGKFNHKVLQVDYNMKRSGSEESYCGISLPVDNGYTTSIASGKAGMGFWYRTATTTDKVLVYFCIAGTDGSNQFETLLPATNGKWQYWYIATDKVDDNTTFGFYINGTKNSKSTGTINADAKFWLSEVEPLTPADVTVDDGEPEEIAPVVRDLTIYQGCEVSNAADVIVTGSIAYHRHAKGGALTNKLDQWYTFAVPFTVSDIEVNESSTWYDINAVYYSDDNDNQSGNPDGPGHFYLQYLKNDTKNQMTNDRWMYINPAHSEYIDADTEDWDGYRYGYPKKDSAYIILFDSTDPIGNYFETNTEIRFVGGPQTIAATAWTPEYDVEETEYWMYANNTLHSITLTNDAYILNEDGTMFVLEDNPTIRPFECYIQATEEFKSAYASIPSRRQGGNTPTAIEDIELNDTSRTIKVLHQGHLIIIRNGHSYDFMGARVR